MAKTPWSFLLTLGLTHFVADAISGFTVTSTAIGHSFLNISLIILSYNIVAFALQPFVGLVVDRYQFHRSAVLFGMGAMSVGLIVFTFSPIVALACIAIGSSMIHVGAGALSSLATPKKSIGAAFFTAPGVIGLTLGTLAASQSMPMIPILLMSSVVTIAMLSRITPKASAPIIPKIPQTPSLRSLPSILIIAFLVLFVAFRSTFWLHESATTVPMLILVFGLSAGVGKLLGGVFADRFGRVPIVSITTVFALLCFAEGSLPMAVVGIFALQSSTSIILSSAVQRMPTYAATVSGLILGLGLAVAGIAM